MDGSEDQRMQDRERRWASRLSTANYLADISWALTRSLLPLFAITAVIWVAIAQPAPEVIGGVGALLTALGGLLGVLSRKRTSGQ